MKKKEEECNICLGPYAAAKGFRCPMRNCDGAVHENCFETFLESNAFNIVCPKCLYLIAPAYRKDCFSKKLNGQILARSTIPAKLEALVKRAEAAKPIISGKTEIAAKEKALNEEKLKIKQMKSELMSLKAAQTRLEKGITKPPVYCFGGCGGTLDADFVCDGECGKTFCECCHEPAHGMEPCNESSLATIKSILADSVACPCCSTRISRKWGCNDMWCTLCKTSFNYVSEKIQTKQAENPELSASRSFPEPPIIQRVRLFMLPSLHDGIDGAFYGVGSEDDFLEWIHRMHFYAEKELERILAKETVFYLQYQESVSVAKTRDPVSCKEMIEVAKQKLGKAMQGPTGLKLNLEALKKQTGFDRDEAVCMLEALLNGPPSIDRYVEMQKGFKKLERQVRDTATRLLGPSFLLKNEIFMVLSWKTGM